MKLYFCILFLFLLFVTAKAQIIRVYCFEQEINGGARQLKRVIPGVGLMDLKQRNEQNKRYFLFAEIIKGSTVSFDKVWIKSQLYSFKTDSIKKLPFILQTSNGGEMIFTDTLVKSSANNIIQLTDLVVTNNKPVPATIKKQLSSNAVVIYYKLRNKFFTANLVKVKVLRPFITQ
jgi:hypothetical protein